MKKDLTKYSNPVTVKKKGKELGYDVDISTRKDKKYMITTPSGKKVHFGSAFYQDYTKHKDEERRKKFQTRNHAWKNSDKYSPAYLSYYILW